jgi:DNA-binding NarL/FixJ family response regulator
MMTPAEVFAHREEYLQSSRYVVQKQRTSLRGSSTLTARERDVLYLLTQGLTNPQIAERLIVSPTTVNAHVRSIYNKLNVSSRSAATRYAFENHLL